MCRHNCPPFRKASKALAEGQLPMPVLMLYADSDTALGTQLVKVKHPVLLINYSCFLQYCPAETTACFALQATLEHLYGRDMHRLKMSSSRGQSSHDDILSAGNRPLCEGLGAACTEELLPLGPAG